MTLLYFDACIYGYLIFERNRIHLREPSASECPRGMSRTNRRATLNTHIAPSLKRLPGFFHWGRLLPYHYPWLVSSIPDHHTNIMQAFIARSCQETTFSLGSGARPLIIHYPCRRWDPFSRYPKHIPLVWAAQRHHLPPWRLLTPPKWKVYGRLFDDFWDSVSTICVDRKKLNLLKLFNV